MASKLSFARFTREDFGRLLLRALMKFRSARMAFGSFVSLVGFSRAFEDELLGMALLAELTAGAFPARRGARLSEV